jgi:hypothetical protein
LSLVSRKRKATILFASIGGTDMTELIVRKIVVSVLYVPDEWKGKVFYDEMEMSVAQAILDGKVEVGLKDFDKGITHWFTLKDVPLDTFPKGPKAYLSVEISEQMVSTKSLVSLEQVAI